MIAEKPAGTKSKPSFRERCQHEGTRNVIFLLQRKRYILTGEPVAYEGGEYGHDGEGWLLGDILPGGKWEPREDSEYLTWQELEGKECATSYWCTESVWLTREEATEYAESRSYNYPDGWLVYGVCAEGELVDWIKLS